MVMIYQAVVWGPSCASQDDEDVLSLAQQDYDGSKMVPVGK